MSEAEAQEHDSEDDDEDYVPPAAGDRSDDDEGGGSGGPNEGGDAVIGSRLPVHKQRAVDDAFASLFGAPSSSSAAVDGGGSKKKGKKKKGAASKKALKKRKALLANMFGASAATKMVSTSAAVADHASESTKRDRPLKGMEKRVVTEKKVFAGREVEVERTVLEPTSSSSGTGTGATAATSAKPPPPSGGGGIDSVLANLSGPQKLSTVAKTSSDWDTFKDKTGLDEELGEKAKGKDAYLVKQDFLQRVDHRTFEVEKADRDRKRAAAGR